MTPELYNFWAMRHMYLGCYCKTQTCGQFHLVHYIGQRRKLHLVGLRDGGTMSVPVADMRTATSGLT
jgi:hypothetical protein